MLLTNALSLNMLSGDARIIARKISTAEAQRLYGIHQPHSAVGHADTAAVFASQLGYHVTANRATVALEADDEMLVGQYSGPRLPEGATNLPEGATIQWWYVYVGA